MSALARPDSSGPAAHAALPLVILGAGVALSLGLAVGHPSPATVAPAIALSGLAVVLLALARPFAGYVVLACSSVFLLVFDLPDGRGINPFDLLLPSLLLAGLVGPARAEARAAERVLLDPRRIELSEAARRLARAVLVFYGIAVLSMIPMAMAGRTSALASSAVGIVRAIQGLMLFPLGLWWLRSEERIQITMRCMIWTGILLGVVNAVGLGLGAARRAGLTWFVNQTEEVIGGPNEVAPAMILLGVMALVRQARSHRIENLATLGIALVMLVASASRSGLLASIAFAAIVMPRARWRVILPAVLVLLAMIPLVPDEYWTRLGRTLAMERGTFEAYTSLIRVYSWKTALAVFLHNPLLGVGYVGYSAVSGDYGALRLVGAPAENYYLETAAGMGIPGLVALAIVLIRLFRLGGAIRRHAPAGSLAGRMARYHVPFLVAILIVNLTGSNLCGFLALAQLAIWAALLVRAGDLALGGAGAGRAPAGPAPYPSG